MGMPKYSGKSGSITDIQMVALNGILTMNDVDYRTLASKALNLQPGLVPGRYKLTYEQATMIIMFGNDLYRKVI